MTNSAESLSQWLKRPRELLRALDQLDSEQSLADFIRLGWKYIDPAPYLSNWHIEAICEHLEAVARGEVRRLLMNIPPRHMKSLGVSVAFPAWMWARNPDPRYPLMGPQSSFLFASYAHSLSVRDSVKCRRLIASPWYQRIWGDRFALTGDQNTKIRFENDRQGYRLATSVDGALTGEGADIIGVDDPHNVREAESETVRKSVLTWFDEAMSTRLNNPKTGAYIIIMQRVHERDLTGHILAKNNPDWTHLCLPARYEPDHPQVWPKDPRTVRGQLLWPERIGEPELRALEAALGSYGAAGQLQQRPAPREGGLFKRRWFGTVGAVPAGATRVRRWDLAATAETGTNDPDWTVGFLMARDSDGFIYLENVVRFRGTPKEVEEAIVNTAAQDDRRYKRVKVGLPEDPGQAGKAQAAYLVRKLQGRSVVVEKETGDKATRAMPFASQAEAGNVKIVVTGDPAADAWIEPFLREIEVFPMGAHDDQVDTASGGFHMLVQKRSVRVPDDVLQRSSMPGR